MHLFDLGFECIFGGRRLGPLFLKKLFLNETPTHSHTRSQLYTLAPTSFSQIELTLRDLNFYSDGTP